MSQRSPQSAWTWPLVLTLLAHSAVAVALACGWRIQRAQPLPQWDPWALPARATISLSAPMLPPRPDSAAETPIETAVLVIPPPVAVAEPVIAALALSVTEPPPTEVTALLAEALPPEPTPTEPLAKPPTPTSPSAEPVPANVSEPHATTGHAEAANAAPLAPAPSDVDVAQRDAVLTQVPPRYPDRARRRGQQGTVRLRIMLTPAGVPSEVTVLETCGFSVLDEAALTAAKQWRFAAASDAERVTTISIQFKLQ